MNNYSGLTALSNSGGDYPMTTTIKSVCPYDCPDTCGLLVEVDNGIVKSVKGDPAHPVTQGLLCPKMLNYENTVYSSGRIKTPLIRNGAKGSGSFRQASWEEAISIICEKWKKLIKVHGGESILPYSYAGTMGMVQRNAGHPFFYRLGASRLERTICSPAKDAGWKLIMGETPACDPSEILESDLIILWGLNASATSIHTMRDVAIARKRGAKLVVIDTYKTPTAESADLFYCVRPGSDSALALAIMHIIVANKQHNEKFIAGNVRGFEKFAEYLTTSCQPEKMAEVCGIPTDKIAQLASLYAEAAAPFIKIGGGLTRYGNGAMTVRTIITLPAISGGWDRKGGAVFCGTSTGSAFGMDKITRDDFIHSPTRIINMNQLGDALNKLTDPPIFSLYVYHSNPASIVPDQNSVVAGLMREDLFTVVHERFMTDTALYADIVLPAVTSLEQDDIFRSYGSYYAQRSFKAIEPLYEGRSNWDTFSLLAKGMGWDEPFFRQDVNKLIEQLASDSIWMNDETRSRLLDGEVVRLQPPLHPEQRWSTPSKKIEIENELDPLTLPSLLPSYAEADQLPLRLMPAVTPFALNSSFYEQQSLRERQKYMSLMMNSEDAEKRGLGNGAQVLAANSYGEVEFTLEITDKVPPGTVVTEGVWWRSFMGGKPGVNALTSQRLTDRGNGSTLYDVAVEVRICCAPTS